MNKCILSELMTELRLDTGSLDSYSDVFPPYYVTLQIALGDFASCTYRNSREPWLAWLSGLSTRLQTKGSPVPFPVREHAWVVGQVPSRGRTRGNHTLRFLFLSFSFPSPLSKNK